MPAAPRKISKPADSPSIRLARAQINTIVGNFEHNVEKITTCLEKATRQQANVVLFPEMAITGYPPEDLLLKPDFISQNVRALKSLIPRSKGLTALIGYVEPLKNALFNSAALVTDGRLLGNYRKMNLPNYGVFDEKRYFKEGSALCRFVQNGISLGVTICEDIWENTETPFQVDILLNISSSPFYSGKSNVREALIQKRAKQFKAYVAYANLVGGQDELVFDGQSLVAGPNGKLIARGKAFEEELILVDLPVSRPKLSRSAGKKAKPTLKVKTYKIACKAIQTKEPLLTRKIGVTNPTEEIFKALVLGTRDYILKNGFEKVVIGLSGGIDSALTSVIATEALGAENVIGVLMPSPYSSAGSIMDSRRLAKNLEIDTFIFSIESAMHAYEQILAQAFRGSPSGIAEENLQARIRGNLLMALSNKMGWLVLTTGNKSEFSVGYCTLYGDMAGGFAVIKDLPKGQVYQLAEYVNRKKKQEVIPQAILKKEPSAELRPDQKDSDSLPEYSILDTVLRHYIEEDKGMEELKKLGVTIQEIERIIGLVDQNEYKRRQGPPGVKITPKAFGKDRRLPITNHYKG
ncbi:MAG: NAD+ synthase [Nitrospinota bacterium]|nr:NAD+ synthase [Nitrospinota bacterium]